MAKNKSWTKKYAKALRPRQYRAPKKPITVTTPARTSGSVAVARMEEYEMVISELGQLSKVTATRSRSGSEIAIASPPP
jgi:hypothetical protein